MGASWNIIMQLAIVAVLFLVVACSGAATPTLTPTLEPTMTAQPTPTPTLEPTATSAPTATLVTPPDESDHAAVKADPRFATIREKMESVEPVWTVYFHSDDWQTPGRNTLMNEVFELLKLENIVSHGGYQEISPEMVVALEPDIIIADSIESVVDNPELASLHMVQEQDHIPHHIFVLSEGNSFSGDGSHFKDAVEELAAFVYPEVFGHEEEPGEHGHEEEPGEHGHEEEPGEHGHEEEPGEHGHEEEPGEHGHEEEPGEHGHEEEPAEDSH